ncbi:GNAT family N-acetyltransferase [Mongoliitalea daihaiensis]|uniref:GNAT family N-acetyltransferase n=1 Tax=Mongoliitalea daihaiensis TaxID=2782006 RepID=UPI001F339717|nr:GNAT family N-acetyltransferase [Mongoliitalea daihaiensis]UJP64180.1 GNAT family N-acetyltransferase [Mongoliitalea daihaiensis]
MKIERLAFDSELFGYEVGRLLLKNQYEVDRIKLSNQPFQLIYINSPCPLDVDSTNVILVDEKLTFQKKLEIIEIKNQGVFSVQNWNEVFSMLAIESGHLSRFKTDKRLKNGEFEKLYKLWIKQAFEQQQLLAVSDNKGIVTVSTTNDQASIGLIAVHPEHRGKGIGKELITLAKSYAYQQGAKSIEVITQANNKQACQLYQGTGFQLIDKVYVYHYWKE